MFLCTCVFAGFFDDGGVWPLIKCLLLLAAIYYYLARIQHSDSYFLLAIQYCVRICGVSD